jgi:hypothetical protein
MDQDFLWPYLPTLSRLALAAAIGLFVGIERERRRKEAGLRTFAFCALIGAVGGLLGDSYALIALGLSALIYGGFTYSGRDTLPRGGSAPVRPTRTVPVRPALAGIAVLAGAMLVFSARRPT